MDDPSSRESAAQRMPGKKLVFDQTYMKPISCKEAVDYILRNEERKLSLLQKLSLWRHFAVCSLCRVFSRQNSLVNHAMKQRQGAVTTLSEEEKKKIIQNVLDKTD